VVPIGSSLRVFAYRRVVRSPDSLRGPGPPGTRCLSNRRRLALLTLVLLGPVACRSVGPPTVPRDRFDYASAISESWKQQMLLNLVKLRYADAPVFLDVASVIAQYTFQAQASAGATSLGAGGSAAVSGGAGWADRPTITYQPLMGQQFTKSLLTPIAPAAVMDLVQAGWPVDVTFRVAVRSINGIQAESRGRLMTQAADPRFGKVLEAMRRLQQKGGISLRVEKKGKEETVRIVIGRRDQVDPDRQFIRETLGLDPDATEFSLAFGALNASSTEVALLTRSVMEIMTELCIDIQVPPEHERDGRAGPPLSPDLQPEFKVLSGTSRPGEADCFARVRYKGFWFWIDDRDFKSKRAMSFLLVLTALAETGSGIAPPAVTISTGP
jgi:hypothetical protein